MATNYKPLASPHQQLSPSINPKRSHAQGWTQSSAALCAVPTHPEPRVLHVRHTTGEISREEDVRAAGPRPHGAFWTRSGYFLKELQIFNFLHFFNQRTSRHTCSPASTLIPRPSVPYDVICNKTFLQVCNKYHIVLHLEPLRLSLGTQREPSICRALVQCDTMLFSPSCKKPSNTQLRGDSKVHLHFQFHMASLCQTHPQHHALHADLLTCTPLISRWNSFLVNRHCSDFILLAISQVRTIPIKQQFFVLELPGSTIHVLVFLKEGKKNQITVKIVEPSG